MKLFEIVNEFQELYDMMCEEDDPDVIRGTLDCLTANLEEKASGYVMVMNQLEMEEKKADELQKKYMTIKNARKAAQKRMKERLLIALDAIGKDEVDAGDFVIKIKNNGGQQPLVITGEVPENMKKITIENDGDKIREYIKNHECKWAHLAERGRHIEIR